MRRGFEPRRGPGRLPGGFVDLGETVEDAARARSTEELALEVRDHASSWASTRAPRSVRWWWSTRPTAQGTPLNHGGGARGRGVRADEIPWQELAFWTTTNALRGLPGSGSRPRAPEPPAAPRRSPLVVAATLAGGYLALVSFHDRTALSVGEIRLSVSPGPQGRARRLRAARRLGRALRGDPAAGAAARRPATVDRDVAQAASPTASRSTSQQVRNEARDAIANYLRNADRARRRCCALLARPAGRVRGPRRRVPAPADGRSAARDRHRARHRRRARRAAPAARRDRRPAVLRLRPRHPARARGGRGRAARRRGVLDQELDAQLVGLARLVIAPGRPRARSRTARASRSPPTCTTTSSRSPILERAADGGPGVLRRRPDRPRLAAGDARSSARVVAHRQAVRVRLRQPRLRLRSRASSPRDGAIVLTRTGRLQRGRRRPTAPIVNTIAGLRVAGYDDPFERRAAEDFARPLRRHARPGRAGARSRPGCGR